MNNSPTTTSTAKKDNSEAAGLLGKRRYKICAIVAIILLAFWSVFTGSVTLKRSTGALSRFTDDVNAPIHNDLDILEIEEREKAVRHMWDVYTHSGNIRLPRFWQEAFEAGYEFLVSDLPGVRDAAVFEIAKMSMLPINPESPPSHIHGKRELKKSKESKSLRTD